MPAANRHRFSPSPIALLLALLLPAAQVLAQSGAGGKSELDEPTVTAKALQSLTTFAKTAQRSKAPGFARKAFEAIVTHYDEDHASAREALGFARRGDEWQRVKDPAKLPPNKASSRQLARIAKNWAKAQKQLTKLHRDLGLALHKGGKAEQGEKHLRVALTFDPDDLQSHIALEHDNIAGFYGTDEQLAFVRQMQAMRKKATECAALTFNVTVLADEKMPEVLSRSALRFRGGRSKHFEHWLIGSEQQLKDSLVWAERALVMVRHLLGEQPLASEALTPNARSYLALLRSNKQRDQLFARCPVTMDNYEPTKARLFSGLSFKDSGTGKMAEWSVSQPTDDADRVVAHVMMRCAAQRLNGSMSEGLVHALTWMMCGTVKSRYMQLAHTAGAKRDAWPLDANKWRLRLEDAIEAQQDWPLIQVPRERMDNYRDPCRAKSWSFCVWLLARHHEDWLDLCAALNQKNMSQDDVQGLFGETLGVDVEDCEAEWRAWARRNSSIGRASGWH